VRGEGCGVRGEGKSVVKGRVSGREVVARLDVGFLLEATLRRRRLRGQAVLLLPRLHGTGAE